MNENRLKIDTLRGMACLLLVAYHVIGSDPTNGLKLSSGIFRDINDVLSYLRMPLFTFLSGFVYAYRPFQSGARSFLSKKARRLIIPMLTVGTTFAILQSATAGSNSSIDNWYLLHIKPVAHFWFIESLFILFVFIVVFEYLNLFDSFKKWIFVYLVFCAFYISPVDVDFFSISGFLYLSPYFLLGMAVERYRLLTQVNFIFNAILFVSLTLFFLLVYLGVIPLFDKRSISSLLLGSISCISLLSLGLSNRLLAYIGVYSYTIYLFHVFFTASSRIFLKSFEMESIGIIFSISLCLGVFGPILVESIFSKIDIFRVCFLGKSSMKGKKA
jgi:peptidoglycan/LPS O-acetylase OafA/YrhL